MIVIDILRWVDDITLRAWLPIARLPGLERHRTQILYRLAHRCITRGHFRRAEEYLNESLSLFPDDPRHAANMSLQMGFVKWRSEDWEGAEQYYDSAYRLLADGLGESDDRTIDVMYRLEDALQAQRKNEKRTLLLERIFEAVSRSDNRAWKLEEQTSLGQQIGTIYYDQGEFEKAREWYKRALSLAREWYEGGLCRDQESDGTEVFRTALLDLAKAYTAMGGFEEAERLIARSGECGATDIYLEAWATTLRQRILMAREQWAAALDLAMEVQSVWEKLEKYDGVADAERAVATCLLAMGRIDEGLGHVRQYVSRISRLAAPSDSRMLEALEFAMETHRENGRNEEADIFEGRLGRTKRLR